MPSVGAIPWWGRCWNSEGSSNTFDPWPGTEISRFSTCLFCHTDLGANDTVPECPVGQRLAFDSTRGRLWVVCTHCGRWNLTPIEERWEPIERCERLFRDTWQRYTVENIGVARTKSRLELVRIGAALPPEIASWRYGARLQRWAGNIEPARGVLKRGGRFLARNTAALLARGAMVAGLSDAAVLRLSTLRRGNSVLAHGVDDDNRRVVIRYSHLARAELIRPARDLPWRLRVMHDDGHHPCRGCRPAHGGQAPRRAQLRCGEQRRSAVGNLEAR